MGSFIALRMRPVKGSSAAERHMSGWWRIRHCFVMIGLIWRRLTPGESGLSGKCTLLPVSRGTIRNAVLVENMPERSASS
jgi:hypothetical protein